MACKIHDYMQPTIECNAKSNRHAFQSVARVLKRFGGMVVLFTVFACKKTLPPSLIFCVSRMIIIIVFAI